MSRKQIGIVLIIVGITLPLLAVPFMWDSYHGFVRNITGHAWVGFFYRDLNEGKCDDASKTPSERHRAEAKAEGSLLSAEVRAVLECHAKTPRYMAPMFTIDLREVIAVSVIALGVGAGMMLVKRDT